MQFMSITLEITWIFLGISILVIFMLTKIHNKISWIRIFPLILLYSLWRRSGSRRGIILKKPCFFPADPSISRPALQTTAKEPFQPLSMNRFHMEAKLTHGSKHMLAIWHQRSFYKLYYLNFCFRYEGNLPPLKQPVSGDQQSFSWLFSDKTRVYQCLYFWVPLQWPVFIFINSGTRFM